MYPHFNLNIAEIDALQRALICALFPEKYDDKSSHHLNDRDEGLNYAKSWGCRKRYNVFDTTPTSRKLLTNMYYHQSNWLTKRILLIQSNPLQILSDGISGDFSHNGRPKPARRRLPIIPMRFEDFLDIWLTRVWTIRGIRRPAWLPTYTRGVICNRFTSEEEERVLENGRENPFKSSNWKRLNNLNNVGLLKINSLY